MKRKIANVAAAVLMLLALSAFGNAQSSYDLSSFVGRWKIDLTRTHMGRGNIARRSPTFTFVFTPTRGGLNMDTYGEYPQPAPTRSALLVPDHKARSCQTSTGCLTVGGNPAEQAYAYFQIDSHLMMRVFYVRGEVSEYTTYAVSADGKIFTMIAWGSEAPDRENVQVFDKQR